MGLILACNSVNSNTEEIVHAETLPFVGIVCQLVYSSQPATSSFDLLKQSDFTIPCAFSLYSVRESTFFTLSRTLYAFSSK